MSQRDSGYARKERDLYVTPEWVTLAVEPYIRRGISIWEPACGDGAMARVLTDAGWPVFASDIEPGLGMKRDFLAPFPFAFPVQPLAIVTNPPYENGEQFCRHAINEMRPHNGMVAMLMRADFDHASGRRDLFADCPCFAMKLALTRRICWFTEPNGKPKASPSFNHAWFLWDWQHAGPPTIAYGP
jgi:hypothetical protein